jgi:hypothetical protein
VIPVPRPPARLTLPHRRTPGPAGATRLGRGRPPAAPDAVDRAARIRSARPAPPRARAPGPAATTAKAATVASDPQRSRSLRRAPLSGDVTQAIDTSLIRSFGEQLGFININTTGAGDAQLERRIVEQVASYGRQLGGVLDAVGVLIRHDIAGELPPEDRRALERLSVRFGKILKLIGAYVIRRPTGTVSHGPWARYSRWSASRTRCSAAWLPLASGDRRARRHHRGRLSALSEVQVASAQLLLKPQSVGGCGRCRRIAWA